MVGVMNAPSGRESLPKSGWRPMGDPGINEATLFTHHPLSVLRPLTLNAETCVRGFAARVLAAAE